MFGAWHGAARHPQAPTARNARRFVLKLETAMHGEDQDRNFQKALARSLRSEGPAGLSSKTPVDASASVTAPHTVPVGDCLDAGALATYHERLLAPEEMISWKQHIAGCPRCQEILTQLEATDDIPFEAERQEWVPQKTIAVPVAPVAQALSSPAEQEIASRSAFPSETPRRASNWRWLVPAGALAATMLVWVAIHERTAPEFELAKNQPGHAPEVSPKARDSAPQALGKEESTGKDLPAQGAPKTASAEKTDALKSEDRGPLALKALPPSSNPKLAAPRGTPLPGDSIARNEPAQMQSPGPERSPHEDKQAEAGVPAPKSSYANARAITESAANSIAPPPAPAGPSSAKKAEMVASMGAATPALDQSALDAVTPVHESAASKIARNSVLVSSPDGTTTWRLAPSGIVERSDNAGSHWTLQKTAIIADLLAGSAPTNKLCWIVGRTGAILRTTDAGKRWQKIPSPTTEDINSVFAVDDQQVTITTTTNKSYKTSDAGITWTRLANP
jgi:Photosynthesis system II assembly factor YCF48